MIDLLSEVFRSVGRRADAANSGAQATLQARLRELQDARIGALGDAASEAGSVNAKLAALLADVDTLRDTAIGSIIADTIEDYIKQLKAAAMNSTPVANSAFDALRALELRALTATPIAKSIADALYFIFQNSITGNSAGGNAITSGSIVHRLRLLFDADAKTGAVDLSIAQMLGALYALANGTTSKPVVRPNLAAGVTVTAAGTAYVYGGYAQLVAASDLAAHSLIALVCVANGGTMVGADTQIAVATGTGGSEVDKAEYAVGPDKGLYLLPQPIQIGANARVALKVADTQINQARVWRGIFMPRPLV